MRQIKIKMISLLLITFLLFFKGSNAFAIPMLSIDLNTSTPGIQSARTVDLGTVFDVNIVYTDDSMTKFDTVIFDLNFNNSGSVLSLGVGPVAGSLVNTAPNMATDVFSFLPPPIHQGDPMEVLTNPPDGPYFSNTGAMGLSSLGDPFVTIGLELDVLALEFNAIGLGSSTLELFAEPQGNAILAAMGFPVEVQLNTATINVRSAAVPTPGSILLLTTGLVLLGRRLPKRSI